MKTLFLFATLSMVITLIGSTEGLGCYNCESRMGSDTKCEDGSYSAPYSENCIPSDNSRVGFFAHYCTKVVGRDTANNQFVTIRTCANRYRNECRGDIVVNDRKIDGCIYSCTQKYCNHGAQLDPSASLLILLLASLTAFHNGA